MTEPEGKGESSATKNPVMAHCDGPNNGTIQPRTQDDTRENNEKEHLQIKLKILRYIAADRKTMPTNYNAATLTDEQYCSNIPKLRNQKLWKKVFD